MMNLNLFEPYLNNFQQIEKVFLPEFDQHLIDNWNIDNFENLKNNYSNAKTLFIDIDETMIHCIDDRDSPGIIT